jgi:hypothetical protein
MSYAIFQSLVKYITEDKYVLAVYYTTGSVQRKLCKVGQNRTNNWVFAYCPINRRFLEE